MDRRQHLATLAAAGLAALSWKPALRAEDKAALPKVEKPKQSLIEISKETTYFTEPLDDEGYLDVRGAANKLLREGVTPENNAAVLLWQAMGPQRCDESIRKEFFAQLGMEIPPEDGKYFQTIQQFAPEEWEKEVSDFDHASEAPWTAETYPLVAKWLKENEEPLRLSAEGVRRPKFFEPCVAANAEEVLWLTMRLDVINERRYLSRAFLSRAMLHAGEGDIDAALHDLFSIRHLAHHTASGRTNVHWLIGIAIDSLAQSGFTALACQTKWMTGQYRRYLKELLEFPSFPSVHHTTDTLERLMFIETVQNLARGKEIDEEGIPKGYLKQLLAAGIDWNETLRQSNIHFDRCVVALSEPDAATQDALTAKLHEERIKMHERIASAQRPFGLLRTWGLNRKNCSIALSEVLILQHGISAHLHKISARRHQQNWELKHLAFALAAYRAEHGVYPRSLEALVPEYFKEITPDRFSKNPLRYEADDEGFKLYSVGDNGIDDGGFGVDDESDDGVLRDDLVIRTPNRRK